LVVYLLWLDDMSSPTSTSKESTAGFDRYWPRRFTDGQKYALKSYNRPYIQRLRDDWSQEDDDVSSEDENDEIKQEELRGSGRQSGERRTETDNPGEKFEEDTSIARIIMRERLHGRAWEEPEPFNGPAEKVESFCKHVTLKDLEKATAQNTESLALLIEQSKTGEFRDNRGGINEGQMYRALLAKVRV
jgi:hypothetical protein